MKKCVLFLIVSLLLTGCGAEETFETIADEYVQSAAAPLRQVILELPEEAVLPAAESDTGTLYLCDGYEICVQTLSSGDLSGTIREVTGFDQSEVTVMQTNPGDFKRYDLVWSTLGESGERLGRAAILDDGNYHYVLSALADAGKVQQYEEVWREMFNGYSLG